jgi:hypothetical protein
MRRYPRRERSGPACGGKPTHEGSTSSSPHEKAPGPLPRTGRLPWTRTQYIRTAAALPFEVSLVETADPPRYQEIALKARHLRELGLSDRAVAKRLGVTDKTVAKAIRWLLGTETATGERP